MRPVSSYAIEGLRRAELQAAAAASNISRMSIETAKALRVEGDKVAITDQPVDLAADSVTLMSCKAQFRANAAVVRTDDDNTRSLLDLIG